MFLPRFFSQSGIVVALRNVSAIVTRSAIAVIVTKNETEMAVKDAHAKTRIARVHPDHATRKGRRIDAKAKTAANRAHLVENARKITRRRIIEERATIIGR